MKKTLTLLILLLAFTLPDTFANDVEKILSTLKGSSGNFVVFSDGEYFTIVPSVCLEIGGQRPPKTSVQVIKQIALPEYAELKFMKFLEFATKHRPSFTLLGPKFPKNKPSSSTFNIWIDETGNLTRPEYAFQ